MACFASGSRPGACVEAEQEGCIPGSHLFPYCQSSHLPATSTLQQPRHYRFLAVLRFTLMPAVATKQHGGEHGVVRWWASFSTHS